MLIQTFPPRLMWRGMAIRAASIWRFVTVGGLESLDAVLTERDRRTTGRGAGAPGVVLLAVLQPARDQHGSGLRSGLRGRLGAGLDGRPGRALTTGVAGTGAAVPATLGTVATGATCR